MTWKCTNTPKGENKLYSDAKGVVPSLDLRFAEGKNLNDYMTGTPLVDHQRSMSGSNLSPGTFVNSNGLIETARVNLIANSSDYNVGLWQRAGSSFTSNQILSPNNLSNAGKLDETASTGTHIIVNNSALNSVVGEVYAFSVFVKAAERSVCALNFGGGVSSTQGGALFDLQAGTVTPDALAPADYGIIPYANGWYRCFIAIEATGVAQIRPRVNIVLNGQTSYTGVIGNGLYVWGAQLEANTTASTYIPTENARSAAPRFDHDPTTGESLGLLIEESRTNYIDNSTTLSFPFIGNGGTGVAPQVNTTTAVGPDGVSASITRCQFDRGVGNSNTDYTLIGFNNLITASAQYCQSVWLKSNDTNNYNIQFYDFGGFKGDEITVTPQWQRFILDANTSYKNSNDTANATPDLVIGLRNDPSNSNFYTGNTNSQTADILVWGPQIENGSFVTSYIPTTGTALTRSADVASISGSDFSNWYNQGEGTVFSETKGKVTSGGGRDVVDISDGSGSGNRILLRDHQFFITNSTVIQVNIGFTDTLNNTKTAAAFTLNDAVIYSDGVNKGTDTSLTLPTVDRIHIGSYNGGGEQLCGCISRLTYFPERLPDSTLQTITTP